MRHGLVEFSGAEHFYDRIVSFFLCSIALGPLLSLLHEVLPHLLALCLSIVSFFVADLILLGALLILHSVQVILSTRFLFSAFIHLLEDFELL